LQATADTSAERTSPGFTLRWLIRYLAWVARLIRPAAA
jgi:hypothetical protein